MDTTSCDKQLYRDYKNRLCMRVYGVICDEQREESKSSVSSEDACVDVCDASECDDNNVGITSELPVRVNLHRPRDCVCW